MTAPTPATVTLPAVGTVQRRWVVVGGVAVAGAVAYAYMKRRKRGTTVTGYETTTGTPALPSDGYQNPAPTSPPSGTVVDGDTPEITSNGQWSAAAVDALAAIGMEPGYVARILGRYLDEQQLTAVEADVVRQAYAMVGYPPHMVALKVIPSTQPPPPGDTPPPPSTGVPDTATAPALVNLYDWCHTIEKQYGLPDLFPTLRAQKGALIKWGSPTAWGTDPRYGNVPYFTTPQVIKLK